MATPPQKPKPPKPKEPADLAEVERALSVLQGRHPETERLRREDLEKRSKREAATAVVVNAESRRLRLRRAAMAAGAIVVVIIAVIGAMIFRSEVARRGRLEQATDDYRAMGFALVDTSSRGDPTKVEASVPAGCILATATVPSAKIKITHPGGSASGRAPVLTCLCEGGPVTVTAEGVGPGEGTTLLRTDAATLGGSRAFAFLPFKPGAMGYADQACAEASLDAWLDAKKLSSSSSSSSDSAESPKPVVNLDASAADKWLAADAKRSILRTLSMKPTSVLKRGAPFVVVEVPADSCVLAVRGEGGAASDKISIRMKGATSAVVPSTGNVAWCTSAAATVLLEREGKGEVTLLLGPAASVGGLFGLLEVATVAGIPIQASSVAATDRGWNGKELLIASAIPDSLITIANAPELESPEADARIVAISLEKPNVFVPETPPDVYSYCDPPLVTSTTSVCMFSGPQKWRIEGADSVGGIARAKLPFWLFALQSVNEPAVLKMETAIISLARKLRRDGFEPTTIDAVTELEHGAEVLGRANEDAMVAFAFSAATTPWVFPYTDGPAWTIESGEPRIVPIKPLERVVVNATAKTLPPKATRRTVVFRRQKH